MADTKQLVLELPAEIADQLDQKAAEAKLPLQVIVIGQLFQWLGNHQIGCAPRTRCSAQEFLRRFLLHVLPRGFVRIRSFGFLANRRRATLLPLCQRLLADQPMPHPSAATTSSPTQPTCFRCPKCSTPMVIVEPLSVMTAWQLTPRSALLDSS